MVRTNESRRVAFGAFERGPRNAAFTVSGLGACDRPFYNRRLHSEQYLHHLRSGEHCIVRLEESLVCRQVAGNTGTICYAPKLAFIKLRQVARGYKAYSGTRFGVLGIAYQNAVTAL